MSVSENSTVLPSSGDNYQMMESEALRYKMVTYPLSPYADPDLLLLDVGPNQTRFRIHRKILAHSPERAIQTLGEEWDRKRIDGAIALPELDAPTAHTLVHYLYTGMYQELVFLKSEYYDVMGAAISAYRLSTCVYCAAVRYKLLSLAELAKEKVMSAEEDLSIQDILSVARLYAFPYLPIEETWYPEYIEGSIQRAASLDPELFTRPDFVDQIEGDRNFRLVVMRAIVNSYAKAPETIEKQAVELKEVVEPVHDWVPEVEPLVEESWQPEPTLTEETPVYDIPVVEPSDQTISAANGIEKHELALEDIEPSPPMETDEIIPDRTQETSEQSQMNGAVEPSPQTPVELEPFTDELGFAKSKTYQMMGKRADESTEESKLSGTEENSPKHKRVDSVVQPTETETPAMPDDGEVASPEPETAVSANGPTAGKKNKRKNKKKSSGAAVPAAAT